MNDQKRHDTRCTYMVELRPLGKNAAYIYECQCVRRVKYAVIVNTGEAVASSLRPAR